LLSSLSLSLPELLTRKRPEIRLAPVASWRVTGHGVDRWFAAGYLAMIVLYIAASKVALSDTWSQLAKAIFNT
jgi:hypothetical protein